MAAHEGRIIRNDYPSLVLLIVFPLVLIVLLQPAFKLALQQQEGLKEATGAEQAVPGMAVIFAFFVLTHVAGAFYREHGWLTWQRIRATHLRHIQIVVGKVLPSFLLSVIQMTVIFVAGFLFLGLSSRGSPLLILAVIVALSICLVGIGMALVAVFRTFRQVTAVTNILVGVLGGLGGSIVPVSLLPTWARHAAPTTPSYWAMRGFRSVIIDGAGWGALVLPIAVLLAFGTFLLGFTAVRFSIEQEKSF